MIYDVTAAPYNGQRYSNSVDALAGIGLDTVIRSACLDAHNAGGGTVIIPSGWYLCDNGFDISALSNVHIKGEGKGLTNIVASVNLDGRANLTHNDVFMGLNFTAYDSVNGGYVWKNVGVSDMTIDCSLQNPTGILPNSGFGRSLAAVEIMNVDNAFIKNIEVIGAFGNGCVISSADPRLYGTNGVRIGVLNPVIEDCTFVNCIRGVLPQYAGTDTPEGITGTVIQIGAAVGGRIHNTRFIKSGGPIIDRFNCDGLDINGVDVTGFSATPVGTNSTGTNFYTQGVNHIRSDFGLVNSRLRNVVMRNGGGIYEKGIMVPVFFNGEVRTPGPQRCLYENIVIENACGRLQITPPGITSSGGQYAHRKSTDKYTHPVLIQFSGWTSAGITVSVKKAGTSTWVSLPLSATGSVVVRRNDTIAVMYNTPNWNWAWYLCPNIDLPGIHFDGGTAPGYPGTARDNTLKDYYVSTPGTVHLEVVDGVDNTITNGKHR
jgi:hypothetical protein